MHNPAPTAPPGRAPQAPQQDPQHQNLPLQTHTPSSSVELVDWDTEDEDGDFVPDSPAPADSAQADDSHEADHGFLDRIPSPVAATRLAMDQGKQAGRGARFKLRSEIVVPEWHPRMHGRPRAGAGRQTRPSYKEALLQPPLPGRLRSQSPFRGYHRRAEQWQREVDSKQVLSGEGWQEVKSRRARRREAARLAELQPRVVSGRPSRAWSAVFLSKMQGRCFNCLAKDHKVATCRDPSRCWSCWRFGHISSRCPGRRHRRYREERVNAARRQSLFERLHWPSNRGRDWDRPPRQGHGDPYRRHQHGGADGERSWSLTSWLSRERSLEHGAHGLFQRPAASDNKKQQPARKPTKSRIARVSRGCGPDEGAARIAMDQTPCSLDDLLQLGSVNSMPHGFEQFNDPMILEARLLVPSQLVEPTQCSMDPLQETGESREAMYELPQLGADKGSEGALQEMPAAIQDEEQVEDVDMVPNEEEETEAQKEKVTSSREKITRAKKKAIHESPTQEKMQLEPHQEEGETRLQDFLNKITKQVEPSLLCTPVAKKKAHSDENGGQNVRRSNRIAEKKKKIGNKNIEEQAQDLVAEKLGILSPAKNLTAEAKEKYIKLYGSPITNEAMEAIDSLLMAMNLNKGERKGNKKKKAAMAAP